MTLETQTQPMVRTGNMVLDPLTEEELDAVTVVFHQYETGLREGTIYTKVSSPIKYLLYASFDFVMVVYLTGGKMKTPTKYAPTPL